MFSAQRKQSLMLCITSSSCLSELWCSDSHAGVELEVSSLVSKGEVVLGQFRFGCVESQLVASQPAFIAQHSSPVDSWAGHIKVQIAAHIYKVTLVAGLQFGTFLTTETRNKRETLRQMSLIHLKFGANRLFLPSVGYKRCVQTELQALSQLHAGRRNTP